MAVAQCFNWCSATEPPINTPAFPSGRTMNYCGPTPRAPTLTTTFETVFPTPCSKSRHRPSQVELWNDSTAQRHLGQIFRLALMGVRPTVLGNPGTDRPVHAAQKRRLGTGWSVP